jgi:hypothetical protein
MDPFDNLWVYVSASGTMARVTSAGVVNDTFATGLTTSPGGTVFDANGNLFVCIYDSLFNASTQKVTQSGVVSNIGASGRQSQGMCVDNLGNVYVGGYSNNIITKFTAQTTGDKLLKIDNYGNILLSTAAIDANTATMAGATASTAGASGVVPVPAAGQQTRFLRGDGTWANAGGASTLVDSSASAQTITLPAATGSGQLLYYTNKAITSTATLAVTSGDALNTVTNGTFLFSNYAVGTQFVVTDYATGKWTVAVEGVSTQSSLVIADYYLASGATAAASDAIFGGVWLTAPETAAMTGGLTQVGQTPSFVLKAGKRYRLTGKFYATGFAIGTYIWSRWRNVTAGAYIGVMGGTNYLSGSSSEGNASHAIAYIEPTVDTTVAFWCNQQSGGQSPTASAERTRVFIEELPKTQAVLAGMVVPQTLSKLRVRRSQASGSNNRTTGLYTVATPNTATKYGFGAAANLLSAVTFGALDVDLADGTSFTAQTNSILSNYTGRVRVTAKVDAATDGGNAGGNTWQLALCRNPGGVSGTVLDVSSGMDAGTGTTYASDTAFIDHEFNITSGDTVDLRVAGTGSNLYIDGISFQIEMVPTTTVINPGTVTAIALHSAQWSRPADLSGIAPAGTVETIAAGTGWGNAYASASIFPLGNATSTADINTLRTGNTIVIKQAGDYRFRFDYTTGGGDAINWFIALNGNAIKAIGVEGTNGDGIHNNIEHVFTGLAVNDVITLRYNNHSSAYLLKDWSIGVTQLPASSIIPVGATTINDQAASGYYDIGTMRVQWGKSASYTNGQTITLPVPFANTNYSLTATAVNGGILFNAGAISASQFSLGIVVSNTGSGTSGQGGSWMAIGLKP